MVYCKQLLFTTTLNYFRDLPEMNWFAETIFRGQVPSTPVLILQLYGKNWYVTRNIRNNEAPDISCTRIKVGLQ